MELSTVFCGEVIEVLGYGIDIEKMKGLIGKNYMSFYDKQVAEARIDTQNLLKKGAVLSDDFIRDMCENPERIFDPNYDTNRPYLLEELRRHSENAVFLQAEASLKQ